ncbi:SMEK domain-containing protein [Buttiauxella gaviniae]|uniref:SMEK domain-containing protein n=1 Tax=Buttiauxella gaviniae TaxID=82990 RepID=UPI0039B00C24
MITSGYMIGQIIDGLSTIAEQAKLRNQLGLTDLSVFAENFFRDILNETDELCLVNTNADKANEPGIDLGDKSNKIGFQITTDKSSKKVINTLRKITDEQRTTYDRFVVLVIGQKQEKYEAVVTALAERSNPVLDDEEKPIHADINFNPNSDIIDITDLSRKVVGLPVNRISNIHKIIQEQTARIKIEMQVPDELGNYETSSYDKWEEQPKPVIGDGSKFCDFIVKEIHWDHNPLSANQIKALQDNINQVVNRLYSLPRVTREFYAVLHERSVHMNERFSDHRSIYLSVVLKTYPDAQDELDLLSAHKLIVIDHENDTGEEKRPIEIGMQITELEGEEFDLYFNDFITQSSMSFRTVLGKVDFSDF